MTGQQERPRQGGTGVSSPEKDGHPLPGKPRSWPEETDKGLGARRMALKVEDPEIGERDRSPSEPLAPSACAWGRPIAIPAAHFAAQAQGACHLGASRWETQGLQTVYLTEPCPVSETRRCPKKRRC